MRRFFVFLLVFAWPLAHASESIDGLWRDATTVARSALVEPQIKPDFYRHLVLDINALENILNRVPIASTDSHLPDSEIITLEVPFPDGDFRRFVLTENKVLPNNLKQKYGISTYSGKAESDPAIWGRFDLTSSGFHGFIRLHDKTVYIDPYQQNDVENYISYYQQDLKRVLPADGQPRPGDTVLDDVPYQASPKRPISTKSLGSTLSTYRLAVATTGEYTQYHGGQVAAIGAITTTINRVTGIYEADFSVSFQLVANNDLLVYTNALTDPYTNDNGIAMLTQNQSNIDAVIGSANYDVGHVFSTAGGGVASLRVPCKNSSKARGVTGQAAPIGDPFDVDYVAHELGHQFGGNHTFNGSTGNCSGGNRNGSTAYEPGSGSTIMAYAGICLEQDLQSNSDAFFNAESIAEVTDYVVNGFGNTCPVITASVNGLPTADADQGFGAMTIPINTPFALIGGGTDPDDDPLTYTWEQRNLGAQGSPLAPTGNAPIFRSFLPTNDPRRLFPKLSDLLNGTQTIGELLPSYSRDLDFRLTVRDGNGGTDSDDVSITVTDSAGPFAVTSPNTAVSLVGGATEVVTWNVANTDLAPVNCAQVDILLSSDAGNSFPTILRNNIPNNGIASVELPVLAINSARIKVACSDNIFFDISDTDFEVTAYNCSGDNVVLDGMVFPATGQVVCTGASSINASTVIVPTGADVIFQSNQIQLTPSFIVQPGASFNATTLP